MKRTLELINMFDSDSFAGQRVRSFDVKNGRPSDLNLSKRNFRDEIFKAYALAGDKGNSPIHFLAIDRINSILAVSPNPATFDEVDKWIQKLDIPAKVTAGSIDNYVYRLRYARAEVVGSVVMQLYGGPGLNLSNGLYGGMPGNSECYPAQTDLRGSRYRRLGYPGGGGSDIQAARTGADQPVADIRARDIKIKARGIKVPVMRARAFRTPHRMPDSSVRPARALPDSPGVRHSGRGPDVGSRWPATGPGTVHDRTGSFLGIARSVADGGYGYNGPRIIPNPFDNTLLVQGTPQQWEQIRHLMEQLDVAPRQVLIDAKIYEIDLTGNLEYGVESFLQKAGTSNSVVPAHQLLGSSTPTSGIGGAAGIGLTAGTLVGQSRQLLAFLQAGEVTSKTKVLSSPSIIATDSIPASITVGSSVPTLTSTGASGVQTGRETPCLHQDHLRTPVPVLSD